MKFIKAGILILIISTTVGCVHKNKQLDNDIPNMDKISEARLDTALNHLFNIFPDSALPDLHWAHKTYLSYHNKTQWVFPDKNTEKLDTLVIYLQQSSEHGLNPDIFNTDTIIQLKQKLKEGKLSYSEMAFLDVISSEAYIRYCKALKFGLTKPREVSPNYHFNTYTIDSIFVFDSFMWKNKCLNRFLAAIQPQYPEYLSLQKLRRYYTHLPAIRTVEIPLLKQGKAILPSDSGEIILKIANRLIAGGELNKNALATNPHNIFNKQILIALNKFRNHHGLASGNYIDNQLICKLNIPVSESINQIDANLERLRWKPVKPLGRKYIRVNVADMSLKAYRNDTVVAQMKVCVGKSPDHRTPFLRSDIQLITLNPVWSIPKNIVVKETALLAAKDTSYLRRHKIRVYYRGKEINSAKVDWSKISAQYQPFRLIQDSGALNALGRIKFNFPNKFSVYLHDTNNKRAFLRQNRAVSHGCVRVEKPLELAFFCLPDHNSNTNQTVYYQLLQDKIRYSIHQNPVSNAGQQLFATNPDKLRLKNVSLYPSIGLLIDYRTCITTNGGKVILLNDIYDLDKYIKNAIQKTHSIHLPTDGN